MGTLVKGTAATYVEELWINTKERYEIRCITADVQRVIRESGIVDGLVLVNPMHITASCFVNDLEYGLHQIGRAHVRTPVTEKSRMPSSA